MDEKPASSRRKARSLYPPSHFYEHEYELAEGVHCPTCGKAEVWVETGAGDYYTGEDHVCLACDAEFTIQEQGPNASVAEQLRSGKVVETALRDAALPNPADGPLAYFSTRMLKDAMKPLADFRAKDSQVIRFRRFEAFPPKKSVE